MIFPWFGDYYHVGILSDEREVELLENAICQRGKQNNGRTWQTFKDSVRDGIRPRGFLGLSCDNESGDFRFVGVRVPQKGPFKVPPPCEPRNRPLPPDREWAAQL